LQNIKEYTLKQIDGFCQAIEKQKDVESLGRINTTRLAVWGDPKDIKKHFNSVLRENNLNNFQSTIPESWISKKDEEK
jgi:hypothetical protein